MKEGSKETDAFENDCGNLANFVVFHYSYTTYRKTLDIECIPVVTQTPEHNLYYIYIYIYIYIYMYACVCVFAHTLHMFIYIYIYIYTYISGGGQNTHIQIRIA